MSKGKVKSKKIYTFLIIKICPYFQNPHLYKNVINQYMPLWHVWLFIATVSLQPIFCFCWSIKKQCMRKNKVWCLQLRFKVIRTSILATIMIFVWVKGAAYWWKSLKPRRVKSIVIVLQGNLVWPLSVHEILFREIYLTNQVNNAQFPSLLFLF